MLKLPGGEYLVYCEDEKARKKIIKKLDGHPLVYVEEHEDSLTLHFDGSYIDPMIAEVNKIGKWIKTIPEVVSLEGWSWVTLETDDINFDREFDEDFE